MNIWTIQQQLASIFDELEENGGELTEELEQELRITQEDFSNKIRDYVAVVKQLEADLSAIKLERTRLADLANSKSKTIERLKKIMIDAIEMFGDTTNKGVKFVDYGIGKVSIRRSKAVELDEDRIKAIGKGISELFEWAKFDGTLDFSDCISPSSIVDVVGQDCIHNNGEYEPGYEVNEDELIPIKLNVSVKIPMEDLVSGKAYNTMKELVKYTDNYEMLAELSKSTATPLLKENGSCLPHLAKFVENKNISIK